MVASYLQKNSTREALDAFKTNLSNLADLVKSLDYDTKYPNPNKRIYKLDKKSSSSSSASASSRQAMRDEQQEQSQSWTSSSSAASAVLANGDTTSQGQSSAAAATNIYWMLQDPIDELKCFVNRTLQPDMLTNRQIDMYNRAAINLL